MTRATPSAEARDRSHTRADETGVLALMKEREAGARMARISRREGDSVLIATTTT